MTFQASGQWKLGPTSQPRKSLNWRALASNYHNVQSSPEEDSLGWRNFLSILLHSLFQLLQMIVRRQGQVSPSARTTMPLQRSRLTTMRHFLHWKVKFVRWWWFLIHDMGVLSSLILEFHQMFNNTYHECSCEYFKDMATKSSGKRGRWASCKHLYFVFTVIGNLKSKRDAFIHAPSFSFNEIKQILKSGILAYHIP